MRNVKVMKEDFSKFPSFIIVFINRGTVAGSFRVRVQKM
jgi:hypothetical protein